MPFTDQCLIITGASSGIGQALCRRLASQRPNLVLAARDATALAATARDCEQLGSQTLVVPTDVTQPEDCRRLIEQSLARFGRIDALVNNAGIAAWARFADIQDLGVFDRVMRVNYLGTVYCTHFALPHLKQSRGRLVIVSSVAGLLAAPMYTAYAPTKHALFGFADALRVELKQDKCGVSVTVIAPDFVESGIHQRAFNAQGQALGETPWDEKRFMSSEVCAAKIVKAMERRQRQAIFSWRGQQAHFAKALFPWLVDWLTDRETRNWK